MSRQSLIMPVINDGIEVKLIFSEIFIWLYGVQIDQLMINKDGLNHLLEWERNIEMLDAWSENWTIIKSNVQCSMPSNAWVRSIWLRKSLLFFVWHNHITWHWHIHHMQKDRRTIVMCWRGLFRKARCFMRSCFGTGYGYIGERLRCADLLNHPTTVRCHCMVLSGAVWWQECGELDSSHN